MSEVIFKTDNIDGFDGFYWDSVDYGAWWAPLNDWQSSHRSIIERLANRRNVLQAGGNLGLYPVLLSRYFKHVYTFEPDAYNYKILGKNIEHHNLWERVYPFKYALGETARTAGLIQVEPTNLGMHRIDDESDNKVEMRTIDELAQTYKLRDIDLIWLDIELYEIHALKGAIETIQNNRPVIIVENAHEEIDDFLELLGYERKLESKMDTVYDLKYRSW